MTVVKTKRIELSTSAHATEDLSKVKQALLSLIPAEYRGSIEIEETVYEGHYGNPITRLVVRLKGKKADRVFKYIVSSLSDTDRNILKATLKNRVDERGHLYMRISKQDASQGKITLYEGDDVIRIVVTIDYPATRERIERLLEEVQRSDEKTS